MRPAATTQFRAHTETVTIRTAMSADAPALGRLAQLDSAPPPGAAPMLVAEVGGELRAALPLAGGPAIADPFHRTADLVAMLARRAEHLEVQGPRRAARRWRPLRGLGPTLAPNA